ncbi:MAG TPA: T9SS type A sorting domain-containing protein [candidate division Zixibacteria bacterium]|nr:VCBS repeat-containing protein [candidate division Zixibacteria bacterium]MDD4916883.1 T9SS type A sorting domain-containing protein [candidate division Zixibacteria bacterium]MDM7971471.1 T9SS type A sorting domain-containing protein [candidate division Zixibacteria bacterium]HPM36410.1 T9SS type A sorting domain-containing protein [candidate division Zixibacteria bacterium]
MRFLLWLCIAVLSSPCAGLAAGPVVIDTLISDTVASWFGMSIVPIGDQNNDGYDDFLTFELPRKLYLCLGGPVETGITITRIDTAGSPLIGNLGDINGDHITDFGCPIRLSSIDSYRLGVWYGGSPLDDGPDLVFGDSTYFPGVSAPVLGNDINGNGTLELISSHSDNWDYPLLMFFELGGHADSMPDLLLRAPGTNMAMADGVITGDFNGDSFDDLVTNMRSILNDSVKGEVLLYWGGPGFDTIPDARITRRGEYSWLYDTFGTRLESLTDVNGDGWDDFFIHYRGGSGDSLSWIHFGGPAFDTVPDVILTTRNQKARLAGDVNHDGYADLITGYATSFSGLGYADIYLGGPDFDSIPDVVIDHSMFSGYYNYFGHEVAGIGDVNGDGIDDFAVASSRGSGYPWVIFIFAGWDDAVSVDDTLDPEPALPTNFTLDQNYPNPFNPITTISFSLPRAETVTLRILNALGQTVAVLINEQRLGPGEHAVVWEAEGYASGVYLYELEYSSGQQSRKMVLIK